MNSWNEYVAVLKRYTEFDGRASRREYWTFVLVSMVISYSLLFMSFRLGLMWQGQGVLSLAYSLAVLLPSCGVAIRRMHDVNKSGWFCIVPVYGLLLTFRVGDSGENRYGADPYEGEGS